MGAVRQMVALAAGLALGGGGLCWFGLPGTGRPCAATCAGGAGAPAIPRDLQSRFRRYAIRDGKGREVLDTAGLVACACLLDDTAKECLERVLVDEGGVKGWSPQLRERLRRLFALTNTDADDGITYAEFCVFFTLLSMQKRQLRMAFEVFDRNEDKCLSRHEFRHLMNALMVDPAVRIVKDSSLPQRPPLLNQEGRAREAGGLLDPDTEATTLMKYTFLLSELGVRLFGRDGSRRISFDDLWSHVRDIRQEVRAVEFGLYDPRNTGHITIDDFRRLMYRGMPVDVGASAGGKDAGAAEEFVSWDFYLKVFDLLRESESVARALKCAVRSKQSPVGAPPLKESDVGGLDSAEFARLLEHSRVVSQLSKSDVERMFSMLDTDGSGLLSPDEFARLCALHRSFFATRPQRLNDSRRNKVQQFVFCMQQLEETPTEG